MDWIGSCHFLCLQPSMLSLVKKDTHSEGEEEKESNKPTTLELWSLVCARRL